jgi:hypothetical protein
MTGIETFIVRYFRPTDILDAERFETSTLGAFMTLKFPTEWRYLLIGGALYFSQKSEPRIFGVYLLCIYC